MQPQFDILNDTLRRSRPVAIKLTTTKTTKKGCERFRLIQ